MPVGFNLGDGLALGNDQGSNTGTSLGTTVTTGTSNNKGSYAQLTASTPHDTNFMLVMISPTSTGPTGWAVDIAVGGAGSENVVIPNIIAAGASVANASTAWCALPVSIPAGARLAARAQATSGASTIQVSVILFDAGFTAYTAPGLYDSIGFNSGTTAGTLVDAGAVGNTKGTWTQLIASTTADYIGFLISLQGSSASGGSNLLV